jgi:hypothetical protein
MVFLTILPVTTRAQEGQSEQFFVAAERTIDRLRDEFRAVVDDDERGILDETPIRIDTMSNDILRVFARRKDDGTREIVISRGFLIIADQIDWALTYELFRRLNGEGTASDDQNVMRYTEHIVEVTEYNTRQRKLGLRGKPWKSYLQWLGKSDGQVRRITEDLEISGQFQDLRAVIKLHAIGLVLGHEIGHQVLGHLDNKTQSVREEKEADAFALKLQMKAGYMPLASASSFLLFAALEHGAVGPDGGRSHPFGLCRLYRLVKAGLDGMEEDKAFLDYIHRQGTAVQFDNLKNQFEAIAPQAEADCG